MHATTTTTTGPRHAEMACRSGSRSRITTPSAAKFDISDLDMPGIDGDLQSVQTELGASFGEDGVALTYSSGSKQQAVEASDSGVALVDRSHWPRLILQGRDRGPLLQKYTTHDFTGLTPGSGCDTVLLDSNGHAVDLVTAFLSESHATLVVSPGGQRAVTDWVAAMCADGDLKVKVVDVTHRTNMLALVGPESENVLREMTAAGAGEPPVPGLAGAYGSHSLLNFRGTPLQVSVGCGLPCNGYTIVCDESVSGELFSLFAVKGCILMGEEEWECTRVLAGRPSLAAGELGPGCAPLEAGLYHTTSLRKAIGYDGMRALASAEATGHVRELWGLSLASSASPGDRISLGGVEVGRVSSATTTPTGEHFALGYVSAAAGGGGAGGRLASGMAVQVGDSAVGTLSDLPYASRGFLAAPVAGVVLGPGSKVMATQAEAEAARAVEGAVLLAAEKKVRVAEGAARLAAWQARQMGGRQA
ncbi:hypothetical protein FOA52_004880 [Chlamydomonas sp. UWO 241]|nr:hypothetical protein FOA52_004880 [Chlamydomonas sp. UWO 241]